MSATEMKEPASPKGDVAARQPSGWIPSCFPSNAPKMRAFCAPKPGNALKRSISVLPSGSLPHKALAFPPYSSATMAQTAWTRSAMAPGKRCSAGVALNSSANFSGSAAAISVALSGAPMRRESSAGAQNARSMGICWSRTMPMRRASGSLLSSASASLSPVRWIAVFAMTESWHARQAE